MNMFTEKTQNVTGFSLSIIANCYKSTLFSALGNAPCVNRLCKKCHVMKWAHSPDITFLLGVFLNTVCSYLNMHVSLPEPVTLCLNDLAGSGIFQNTMCHLPHRIGGTRQV